MLAEKMCFINLLLVSICCLLVFTMGCNKAQVRDTEIIAHRGASHDAPENTMSAITLAYEQEADSAECDVHLTLDKKIVLMHDHSTKRTTGVNLLIKESTSDELEKLDAGSFKGGKFEGEKIPLLEDMIAALPEDEAKRLYVEIKCGEEILPYLEEILSGNLKRSQIVIISFDLNVVSTAKKMFEDIPVYWLVGTRKDEDTGELLEHDPKLIQTALENNLDGLNVNHAGVTQEFAEKTALAGLKLYVWTVDDVEIAKKLKDMGVAGITTNQPALLLAAFRE